jgi:hypothetical protein
MKISGYGSSLNFSISVQPIRLYKLTASNSVLFVSSRKFQDGRRCRDRRHLRMLRGLGAAPSALLLSPEPGIRCHALVNALRQLQRGLKDNPLGSRLVRRAS